MITHPWTAIQTHHLHLHLKELQHCETRQRCASQCRATQVSWWIWPSGFCSKAENQGSHTRKNWLVVSNILYFHPYLGKIPILTNIFQTGWNHQLEKIVAIYPPRNFHFAPENQWLEDEFPFGDLAHLQVRWLLVSRSVVFGCVWLQKMGNGIRVSEL